MEVSYLSQHFCPPREGNLDYVYCIFIYVQKDLSRNTGRVAYDTMHDPIDENVFEVVGKNLDEWKYIYPDSK